MPAPLLRRDGRQECLPVLGGAGIPACRWLGTGGHSCLPVARYGRAFLPAGGTDLGGAGIPACRRATMSEPRPRPELRVTRRHLPHWQREGSTYFVTFRLRAGALVESERRIVGDHVRAGHGRFYALSAAVVMPDHVHLILRPLAGYDLSRVMKGVKGVSANLLNRARGSSGHVWQDESYDRILRDEAEFNEKLEYMLSNPVKAGLCPVGEEYDGWLYIPDSD
ncbi:MAG: hypothetical protein C0501_06535 [Isosphaera sp.]|nr:hypothetical protein [Isosphaera sp.]